jgi:hypothetical protein
MQKSSASRSRLAGAVKVGAVVLLVGSALQANIVNLVHLYRVQPAPNDFTARRDQRFELLRDALPKRGLVGYISDAATEDDHEARRMRAQFALAPLIVVPDVDQPLVVGDFTGPAAVAKGRELNLTVVRDLGDGLVLFAHSHR